MTTVIKSKFGKTLQFRNHNNGDIALKPLSWGYAHPNPLADAVFTAEDILDALKAEGVLNGTLITDLPEAKLAGYWVASGDTDRSLHADPAEVLQQAKALLAIHAFLVKHNEEKEAAKAAAKAAAEAEQAKEEAKATRRGELAGELWGVNRQYRSLTTFAQKAIDRIIELEEAAK